MIVIQFLWFQGHTFSRHLLDVIAAHTNAQVTDIQGAKQNFKLSNYILKYLERTQVG
jgi:hypothetical protein